MSVECTCVVLRACICTTKKAGNILDARELLPTHLYHPIGINNDPIVHGVLATLDVGFNWGHHYWKTILYRNDIGAMVLYIFTYRDSRTIHTMM